MIITEEQYQSAISQREAAQRIINEYARQFTDNFKERWQRFEKGEIFNDADLTYSATSRCKKCNAGLAYPKDCDPWHQWTCSNVLKGIGTDAGHDAFAFAFYEIKVEGQIMGSKETTRPL